MSGISGGALSRRQVVGTVAVSAAGMALPTVPGLPTQEAYAAEEGDRHGARVTASPSTAARTTRSASTTPPHD